MTTLAHVPAEQLARADRVRRLPPAKRAALYARIDAEFGADGIAALEHEWEEFFARPDQVIPREWRGDLVVFAGARSDGKTTGAVRFWAREIEEGRSLAPRFFCATDRDVEKFVLRKILPALRPERRPEWLSEKMMLVFQNGIIAQGYAAAALDSSVGDDGDLDLYDDVAKWGAKASVAWFHARTSCRLAGPAGARGIVATTRRGTTLLRKLLGGDIGEVRRAPYPRANRYNLAPGYYKRNAHELGDDAFYRQEIDDEDISDRSPFFGINFDAAPVRVAEAGEITHIAIPVDPAEGKGPRHDLWGVGAMGRRRDRHVVALEDASGSFDDTEAGAAILELCDGWQARYPNAKLVILAENNRGPRVLSVIRAAHLQRELDRLTADPNAKLRPLPEIISVKTQKSKRVRAEQVRPLLLSGLMHHVAGLELLERQAREWDPEAPPRPQQDDRIDWYVIGAHHLAELVGEVKQDPVAAAKAAQVGLREANRSMPAPVWGGERV